jgi:hypothetical protein
LSQPLVLAIEPDLRQAAIVKRIVREKALADVVLVDSLDAAIEAMRTSMPDVLLLSALLSPRDEDDLISHLKTLEHAGHLQTHTIPQLASSLGPGEERASKGLLSAFRRKKEAAPVGGCDPDLFAEEIRSYLTRAADKKRELQNMTFAQVASRPDPAKPSPPQAAASDTTDDSATPSGAWASPFEWKPASTSKRSSRKSDEAPAHHAAPPPPPVSAPQPVVAAPAAEPLSVIKPAVEEPVIVAPAAAERFVAEPVVTESVIAPPIVTERTVAPPVVPEPVVAAPVAAAPIVAEPLLVAPIAAAPVVEPPIEIVEPARKAAPKHAETPGPKAVADRPPKLTGRAQLRDLIIKGPGSADGRGHDRLGPLARWARTDAPRGAKGPAVTSEDVRSLISSLAVPAAVASVSYPRGVRIRRVRVPLSTDHEAGVQASA